MSFSRSVQAKNGDYYVTLDYYNCDCCNTEIFEADRHYSEEKNSHLCIDCAFITKLITEKEYLESCGIYLDHYHAGISPEGTIVVWMGKLTPPWEQTIKQERRSARYAQWRSKVFERDKYTCQDCGRHGGKLNAHHLKSFSKYKRLRHKVSKRILRMRTDFRHTV